MVVPNTETNFKHLETLFNSYEYSLVSDISLSELLDDLFVEAFIKNGES